MAKFVAARKRGSTNTRAAVKAGYSEKTAAAAGSRLAKHPLVMAALSTSKRVMEEQRKARERIEAAFTKGAAPEPEVPSTVSASPVEPPPTYDNPKDFLKFVMNDPKADLRQRVAAAKALIPSEGRRAAPLGKKEEQQGKANKVATGSRFSPGAPPRLVANNQR